MGTPPRLRSPSALLLACAALGFAACGGSGGGGHGPEPSGAYQVVALRRDVAGNKVRSLTAIYEGDGTGTLHGVMGWERDGGALIGPSVPGDLAFTVDAARAISVSSSFLPALDGRVTADGFLAVLASQQAGSDPALLVMARRRSSVALADVVGEWWWIQWSHDPANVTEAGYCAFGEAQVATNGTLGFRTYTYNDDGMVDPLPPVFAVAPLTFDPDGSVLVDVGFVPGTLRMRGGLSEDGRLLLLAFADGTAPADASVAVLVRRGQAQDLSDVAGDLAVFGFQTVGVEFASTFGAASIPGLTGGTLALAGNRDGSLVASSDRPLDAFVYVSGEVSLEVASTARYRGGIGRDGDYGVVGGAFTAGLRPTTLLWVR